MGGKAFEGVTQRIKKEHIQDTINWLFNRWKDSALQPEPAMERLLGSAGKNADSGDIDLNLRIELYDQEKVAKDLIAILGEDYVKPRPGNNQIFTAVPIGGSDSAGRVQVDFMFGDYEWQKFSYFSPRYDPDQTNARYYWRTDLSKSCLKGLYRTELIKALVAFNSDWVLEQDDEMVARVGPTFFHDKGLVWRYRHRPMRKDGTARIKELKELSREEFMALYPSAVPARTNVCLDPKLLPEMLLAEHYTLDQFNTFEGLWLGIMNCYTAADQKIITKIYLERLNSLKVDIPKDIFANYRLKV